MPSIQNLGNTTTRMLFVAICLLTVTANSFATERQGLILQVSDNDPKTWNLALNIAMNAPTNADYPLDVTVVTFGPGLKMLMMDSSVTPRLKKAADKGVEFRACGMTMKKLKLKNDDLYSHERVKRVDAAVLEIMRLQKAGWFYVKP